MARNQEQWDDLVEVLEDTKVPFMVGCNRRFSPAARWVKETEAERQNLLMVLYRVNAGCLPPDHRTQAEEGCGRIIGEACHTVDRFNYWVIVKAESVIAQAIASRTGHALAGDKTSVTIGHADGSVCVTVAHCAGNLRTRQRAD